jgi:hydroxyethylthiazole kinase-like sugar kinase family protein
LTSRANPKTLVAQGRDEAVTRARSALLDDQGSPRVERLVAAGAAVVVLVALFVAARRRSRRG